MDLVTPRFKYKVVGAVPSDAEKTMAEIAYVASTLRDAATLWFKGLTINPVAGAGVIATLDALIAAFELQFAFDPAQKWRYLPEFFKTKQNTEEKLKDFIRRVQEAGLKAKVNDEQIRHTMMEGFLLHIQLSLMNHDIEPGAVAIASIKKWAIVDEFFPPVASAQVDTAKLQRQIEELSAKLESTQVRVV